MRQVEGFVDRSTGKGAFRGEFEARHCNQWVLYWRTCKSATVPQPSELRFGVVRAVSRGIAVLDGGPRHARGREGFVGFLFLIFTMGNAIGSPTVKCFRFVCENLTIFPSANVSLES